MGLGSSSFSGVALVPRILVATDGTLTHILEAYAAEKVYLVKLFHALVTDPSVRMGLDLATKERALRRVILLRGTRSHTTFVYADSVVMLDRLPATVAAGLLETDTPIGKLLFSSRVETYREIVDAGVECAGEVAAHLGLGPDELLVHRTYQIVFKERTIARITEKFPASSFPDTDI